MKSPISSLNRKQTASFRIAGLMLAIAPLWLMLAAANTSAHAQTSDDVSSATTALRRHPRTGRSSTGTTCSAGTRMRRCLASTMLAACS